MSAIHRVRVATLADVDTIAAHRIALLEGTIAPDQRSEAAALLETSQATLHTTLADGSSLAWVTDEPVPLGSLVMHLVRRLPSLKSPNGLEGYVVHVFVDANVRGGGRGAALLAAAEAAARERGLSRIRLHAEARALEFYRRAGYELRTMDMELLLLA